MLDDGELASWWRRKWSGLWSKAPHRAEPAANSASFAETVSDFSRKLGERTAQRLAAGPITEAQERRAAMVAYDRNRRRKQFLVAGFATGGLIALAIASLAPPGGGPPGPPNAVLAAAAEPPPAAPAETMVASIAPVAPMPPAPVETSELTRAAASPPPPETPQPLSSSEIRELQSRLRGFGFSPGPLDGNPGRLTTAAVMRYQESRNLPQTGEPDRELLDMLRTDMAPQVAPPPPPTRPQPRYTTTASRSPNPLDRLGRWLDSLVR